MEKLMHYSQYKKHYSDCATVPGSYDKASKNILVIVPDGRMKPSGVRGQTFKSYQIGLTDKNGKHGYCTYKAVCEENAMKKHIAWCRENGWTPGDVEHIYF
jgi:hypothetical protein